MVEPNLRILLVYFGLLKPNLSIIRRLASLGLSGITVAQVVLYSPTNVYVLARRFLCPVSCLSAVSEESRSIYDSKASVLFLHICTCRGPANRCNYAGFTFVHSAGPPGDQNVRTYIYIYIDRVHVEFDRRGSLNYTALRDQKVHFFTL